MNHHLMYTFQDMIPEEDIGGEGSVIKYSYVSGKSCQAITNSDASSEEVSVLV